MSLEKGTTLAGYRVEGILGQGGMGIVYEATQVSLDRTVALKVLAPHLSGDILFRERFRREGQIQAGIDHQHIVTVYEAGESEHGFFIAMRLIRGPNLKDMIVSRELDPGRTLRILVPVAEALDTAHEAGLIHRDVKPQNILVGSRDQAFLADFGLTKATGEKSLTRTGQFVGTFDYISPEQIMGERATTRSDVYALAAVLYECFTGVIPYPKDSEAAVLYAHMADPPPKITDHRPELPATLDQVIASGMAKDPAQRYNSPGQLLLEANRTFTQRMRAAFTPPRPIEAAQETGIRPPEAEVPTREGEPPTEPGALEADTVSPQEGVRALDQFEATAAESASPGTTPGEPVPADTAAAEAAPDVTTPAAKPEITAPGAAPLKATTSAAQAPDVTTRAGAAPGVTAPTERAPGERTERRPADERRLREPAEHRRPDGASVAAASPRAGATARPGAVPAPAGAEAAAGRAAQPGARTRPAPTARRAGAPVLIGAAAVVALLIAAAGFLVGRSGGESDGARPAAGNLVSAGALELNFPAGWRRAGDPPEIPGLSLRDPIALSQRGRPSGDALMAGMSAAKSPELLPPAFLARLGDPPARDDAVRLGDLEMYRYRGLAPKGLDQPLTLYVSPTTEGVATVACAGAAAFLSSCEQLAGGLTLTRGKEFALGADNDYLAELDSTMERLNANRRRDTGELRKAKSRAGQAKAAEALAGDYRRARGSLGGLSVSPAVQSASAAVRTALARTEAAYRRLADAARGGSQSRFSAARADVRAGEAALKRALSRVDRASG